MSADKSKVSLSWVIWAVILFVELRHNCILNLVNHHVFPAKASLTVWSVQRELRRKEAEQIVSDVLDHLLKGIQAPERPRSPVDAYVTEEELFRRKNPKVGLFSSLDHPSDDLCTSIRCISSLCWMFIFISLWSFYTWNGVFPPSSWLHATCFHFKIYSCPK